MANLYCSSRYSGVVTGVGDADHSRWPNSKWRCLMVPAIFYASEVLKVSVCNSCFCMNFPAVSATF